MNGNSILCRFIAEHPLDWEHELAERYGVKVKKEGSYAIFNYGYECDHADPIVQEARGIIIDHAELEVVCWPFRKFGNYNESYADTIDWESARVLEKVDGSIIKLWFDKKNGKWQFSTNGTIRAEEACVNNSDLIKFGDIIVRADNYGDIPFDSLDKDNTYIFELVSPETQVVVRYDTASLYHIGTRSNKTGTEFEIDIGIKKPASYKLGSLEQCIIAAIELNVRCGLNSNDDIAKEGFVVVDKDWHRVKIKSPDYLMVHHFRQMSSIGKKDIIKMIVEKDNDIEAICDANPQMTPMFKFYDFKLAEMKYTADRLGALAMRLYREYSGDRSAVARIILKHRLSDVGFRCLDSGESGGAVLMRYPIEKLAKLIPDYEEEDMYSLFREDERK